MTVDEIRAALTRLANHEDAEPEEHHCDDDELARAIIRLCADNDPGAQVCAIEWLAHADACDMDRWYA